MGHPPAGGAPPSRRPAALVLDTGEPGRPLPFRGSTTIVHELGHHLEHAEPGLLDRARAFRDSRRGRGRSNRERFPIDEYAAARYTDRGREDSTEVISVGVEQLYRRPAEFAKEDPEYFDFIWENVVGR